MNMPIVIARRKKLDRNCIYQMSQEKFKRLAGYGIKGMRSVFKTEMLIYKSKANLDEKIFLIKSLVSKTPKISKMSVRGLYGTPKLHVPLWSIIYEATKFTLSVSEI